MPGPEVLIPAAPRGMWVIVNGKRFWFDDETPQPLPPTTSTLMDLMMRASAPSIASQSLTPTLPAQATDGMLAPSRVTDAPPPDWRQQAMGMGLRTVPAAVGSAFGPVGGFLGGSLGELAGELYEGRPVNWGQVGMQGALNLLPGLGAGRQATRLGLNAADAALPTATSALAENAMSRLMRGALSGATLAPVSTMGTNAAEGRPLTANLGLNTVMGAATGGAIGGAMEAGRAAAPYVAQGAQQMRETLGDLAGQYPQLWRVLTDETGAVGDLGPRGGVMTRGVADDIGDDASEELVKGSAGWFPPELKTYLDSVSATMRENQRAKWIAAGKDPKQFGPQVSEIQTAIKDIIRNDISKGDARVAQRLIDGYFTTALPSNYRGVNFDERRPVYELFRKGTGAGDATFDETSQRRVALAYEQGVKRAEREQWGDSRWLYHLSNGDPNVAVQVTRLLGAFSPGQQTDANTLNAIEAFLRSMAGESAEDILGHLVPDPGRPGKMMRVGASLSTGHPRPSTVEDNLKRAMQFGRIFAAKVEALAGAELGLHDDIPIDLWLMRAIGASSDTTPQGPAYRLISEAMAKEAAARGESPFMFMAKVWMGMQEIARRPSPSFAESAARLRLPGHLQSPNIVQGTLGDIAFHAAGVKDPSVGGARSVIATSPKMPFADWEREAQALFRRGKDRDVLGKQPIPKESDPVEIDDFIRDALETDRSESYRRGAARPGQVTGSLMVEAAPGASSRVMPGFRALPQDEQDKMSRSLLKSVRGDDGIPRMVEAVLPGRAARPLEGQGHYASPQGVERNLVNTTPIVLDTAPSGRRLTADSERRAAFVARYLGTLLGQEAVPVTSVQFDPRGGARNVVRVWPGPSGDMPRANGTLGSMLPPLANDDWVIQHRDTGADIFTVKGKTLPRKDIDALTQAGFSVMDEKAARGAGSRAGRNIAKESGYVSIDWGPEGSRQVTVPLLREFARLPAAVRRRADVASMADAAKALRRVSKDPNTSPSHLNLLRIMSKGGLTAVLQALKDPAESLPVLAALGVGLGALAPRRSESPDER